MNNRRLVLGWMGIFALVAVTFSAMVGASAIGLAKTPSAATLEEEGGGAAASDTSDVPAGPSTATVDVTLSEWSIKTSVATAKAGPITFNIQNAGPANSHEFIILKTDITPDSLPTLGDNSLDESGDGITSPGEGGILAVGQKQTVTVPMTEGKYVFVDNIVEKGLAHWEKKAYGTFTVEPPDSGSAASSSSGSTRIVSLTSPVSLGKSASIKVQTSPGASCSIVYTHPSGKSSTAPGLDPATADDSGSVSWTWTISLGTKPVGNGIVSVTCDQDKVDSTIVIQT